MRDLDDVLKRSLKQEADGFTPSHEAASERFSHRRRRRTALQSVFAVTLAAALVAIAVAVVPDLTTEGSEEGLPATAPAVPRGELVESAVVEVNSKPGFAPFAESLTVTEGAVLVGLQGSRQVLAIDPQDNSVEQFPQLPAGDLPRASSGEIAYGNGVLWGASSDYVGHTRSTTDPDLVDVVWEMSLENAPSAVIAAPDGTLWTASEAFDAEGKPAPGYSISTWEPDSQERPRMRIEVGGPAFLDHGFGSMWAAVPGKALIRADLQVGEWLLDTGPAMDVSVGAGSVWTIQDPRPGDPNVYLAQIDPGERPQDASIVRRILLPRSAGGRVIATDELGIFVLNYHGEVENTLLRFDPVTGEQLGQGLPFSGAVTDMEYAFGSLWISEVNTGVHRIDVVSEGTIADTEQSTQTPRPSPEGIGEGEDAVVLEPPLSLRDELPDRIDSWVRPGLVLLVRTTSGNPGEKYSGYFEDTHRLRCPDDAGEAELRDCVVSAYKMSFSDLDGDGRFVETLDRWGHRLLLSEYVPEGPGYLGTEVLWSGPPGFDRYIGIDSPAACLRAERFAPYFECVDGEMVPVD